MRKILPIAVLAAGLAAAGTAYAGSSANSSGGVGTNVGDAMSEPMVVTSDNGNVRDQPNATAKIVTTVPHGKPGHDDRDRQWRRLGSCHGRRSRRLYGPRPARQGAGGRRPTARPTRRHLRYMVVDSDNGNIRAQPTNESALLVTLPRGSRVALARVDRQRLVAYPGQWCRRLHRQHEARRCRSGQPTPSPIRCPTAR